MRVSAQRLGSYTASVTRCQRECAEYVRASLCAYRQLNPSASVADLRDYATSLLCEAVSAYGDQASYVACAEYDATVAEMGIDLPSAELWDGPDEGALAGTVRWRAGALDGTDDGFSRFCDGVSTRAWDEPLRAANGTTIANATRDRDRGMRYARVPTGRETCGFCLMLASRGFVYTSEGAAGRTAGLYNRYHDRCDCRVVAGRDGDTVDGYDPGWLAEVYADARATVDADEIRASMVDQPAGVVNKRVTDEICKEIERRDPEWAWHGKTPAAKYVKPRSSLTKNERVGVDSLAAHGFAVTTVMEDGKAAANMDIRLGGRLWEMKNVTNDSSASNQVGRARKKWYKLGLKSAPRYVFTTNELRDGESFNGICQSIRSRLHRGEEALVISSDDGREIRRMSK